MCVYITDIISSIHILFQGEFKKVDNPRDLLGGNGKRDWTIEENLPGHYMTVPELL